MIYFCNECKAVFDEPAIQDDTFSHAFGTSCGFTKVCPHCESGDFEKAVPCGNPSCNDGYMRDGDHLCSACRSDLLGRITAFFDELTAEEEAQFDEWMDGGSIEDREEWI